jgi:hypothetical protein
MGTSKLVESLPLLDVYRRAFWTHLWYYTQSFMHFDIPRLASPCQTRFRTRERAPAAAEKKDRLEAISLPTVTHALHTYGSCLATRCRFAPRADCGRTSCASTTAHMCILGLTHTLTDSCNPAKLSGRPLWQHDTGGSSSSRTGAHPHVRPGEKSSQTGCCSRIDLPRSAISTPELPLACSICVLARTILRWREAAAWRADETR